MHGAGNSFTIVDNMDGSYGKAQLGSLAEELCEQYHCDGILVTIPAETGEVDFGMLYYNADGSLGEMCGNGARCIARYGFEHGLALNPENIRIQATAGIVTGKRITEELYEVRLNDPTVAEAHRQVLIGTSNYDCGYVELGDPGIPHAVVSIQEDAFSDEDALRELGRALRYADEFPKGANVTFICKRGDNAVRAVTFERGVEDFTLACGTGCGATAVICALRNILSENRIKIDMPGGHLSVRFEREEGRIFNLLLTGPTAYITD